MHNAQRLINHVALVLDGSSSMSGHQYNLIKVADEQIKHLAMRSEELSQETRVSVYLFNYGVECLIFDMDVMRLPSISDLYRANGMTALVDAVIKSQSDLSQTAQIYGDHAFLSFILTDGMENKSKHSWTEMAKYLDQGVNWSTGFLVPDSQGVAYMQRIGVDRESIAIWDATSDKGLIDSFTTIKTATDNFMNARSTGVRGTRSVFSTGADAVNKKTVAANLVTLKPGDYDLVPVNRTVQISDFVKGQGYTYRAGMAYYQLTKRETIQAGKAIIVVEKKTGKAFAGDEGRSLIGLPPRETRVSPDQNPKFDIFVQSTSHNRKLVPSTKVLLVK